MTLITAAFCTEGLLFAADREESTARGGKRSINKLFFRARAEDWTMLIGTAGHSAVCDIAVVRLTEEADKWGDKFYANHQDVISTVLYEIHQQAIPDPKGERAISFIIALYSHAFHKISLYTTCEDLLQPANLFSCTGAGEDIANYFLDRLYEPTLNRTELTGLLTFVLREAKATVGGVGLGTDFFFLDTSGLTTEENLDAVADAKLPQLQDCMRRFWKT